MWAQGEDGCCFAEGWWSYAPRRTLWNQEHVFSMSGWMGRETNNMQALPRHTFDHGELCLFPSKDHSSSDPYLDILTLLLNHLWWREMLSVEVGGSKHDFRMLPCLFPHIYIFGKTVLRFPQLRQKLRAVKELLFTFHTAAPFFVFIIG